MAALTAALVGLTAVGVAQQYSATNAAATYQKSVADTNRQLADMGAEDAIKRGDVAAGQQHKKTKQLIGAQRAAAAANGANVNSGSISDITSDTETLGAIDALNIKANAAREAFGYKVQGINYTASGMMAQAEARAKNNSTLLTGGIQMASAVRGKGSDFWMG